MSSDKDGAGVPLSPDVEEEESTGYKPPAEKSLSEILNTDKEDESLARWAMAKFYASVPNVKEARDIT